MPLLIIFIVFALVVALAGIFVFGVGLWGALLCLVLGFIVPQLIYFIYLLIVGSRIDITKPIETQRPLYRKLVYLTVWLVSFYFGIRVKVENEQLLPKDGRFLLISNHRSAFDPLAFISKLPAYNVSYICKPSIMRYPPIKTVAYGAGYMAIDRDNDRKALKTIISAADYLKRDLCSIGIYPEGTRSKSESGELLPFHAGSFKIAQRANVPVVLMSTVGTEKLRKNFPLRTTAVTLKVLEVIPADKVKKMPTVELAEYSRSVIQADVSGKVPEKSAAAI